MAKTWIGAATAAALWLGLSGTAAAAGERLLLVGNKGENSLSIVDLASGEERVRLPTGPAPHEIAVSPDGRAAAIVSYGGRSIDLFDIPAQRLVRTIDLAPNEGPHGIAWLPDGRILVTTERSRTLAIVDTAAGDRVTAVETGEEGTHMVAADPDGRRAYTANIRSGSISVIDPASGRLLNTVRIGGMPEGIALSPDGQRLWVGDNEGARVLVFDTRALEPGAAAAPPIANISYEIADAVGDEGARLVADPIARALLALGAAEVTTREDGARGWVEAQLPPGTAREGLEARLAEAVRAVSSGFPQGRTELSFRILDVAPRATLSVGPVPIRVLVSPDGRRAVTSNLGDGTLTLIDADNLATLATVPVGGSREAGQVTILFSADGRRLFVAETGRDTVAEVDLEARRVLRRLPAGRQGDGLALVP
jgi:YVTN family beta-propeller protein